MCVRGDLLLERRKTAASVVGGGGVVVVRFTLIYYLARAENPSTAAETVVVGIVVDRRSCQTTVANCRLISRVTADRKRRCPENPYMTCSRGRPSGFQVAGTPEIAKWGKDDGSAEISGVKRDSYAPTCTADAAACEC